MTIDHTGRAHRPAGSPASTGGQFAAQAAPAAAAQLSRTMQTYADEAKFGRIELDMDRAAAHVALGASARRIRESLADYPWIRAVHFQVNEYAGDYEADSIRVAVYDEEQNTTQIVDTDELGDGTVDDAINQEIVQLGTAVDKLDALGADHILDLSEDGIEEHERSAVDYATKAQSALLGWAQEHGTALAQRAQGRSDAQEAARRRSHGEPPQDGPF